MPDITWKCANCEEKNYPYTSACRSCGQLASPALEASTISSEPVAKANLLINWWTLLGVILICCLSAVVSISLASLSINMAVVYLFMATNIGCLLFAVGFAIANKFIPALLFALAPTPVGFGLTMLFWG